MWESRVLRRASERLELHEGKLSRAVLRGGGGGDVTSLPDPGWATTQVYPARITPIKPCDIGIMFSPNFLPSAIAIAVATNSRSSAISSISLSMASLIRLPREWPAGLPLVPGGQGRRRFSGFGVGCGFAIWGPLSGARTG